MGKRTHSQKSESPGPTCTHPPLPRLRDLTCENSPLGSGPAPASLVLFPLHWWVPNPNSACAEGDSEVLRQQISGWGVLQVPHPPPPPTTQPHAGPARPDPSRSSHPGHPTRVQTSGPQTQEHPLTWLAKSRWHTVWSSGSFMMARITCSIGVMPAKRPPPHTE